MGARFKIQDSTFNIPNHPVTRWPITRGFNDHTTRSSNEPLTQWPNCQMIR